MVLDDFGGSSLEDGCAVLPRCAQSESMFGGLMIYRKRLLFLMIGLCVLDDISPYIKTTIFHNMQDISLHSL
jgi:hypothetical protein